jgi:outer membrane protein assembly factor BamB
MRIAVFLLCLIITGCTANTKKTMPSVPQTKQELPDPPTVTKGAPPKPEPPVVVADSKRWQPKADDPNPQMAPAPTDDVPDLRSRKTGSDWPYFLGPTRDGVSTEKGIIAPWPEQGLRLMWFERMGTGYVMPAISKGRCFVFDGLAKDRTAEKQRLRCLKSETGKLLWTFEYPSDYRDIIGYDTGPRCSPIVDGGRVYIYGPEGILHCLSVVDGKVIWKVDTVARFGIVQNFFGVGSTPVIEGDLLIAQVGGSPPDSPDINSNRVINNGTAIVAFDKYTGKIKHWIGDELASYAGPVLATIDGRRRCLMFARGGLLCVDPMSWKVDFHYPWRAKEIYSVNASNPVAVGDKVFVSECYQIGGSLLKIKGSDYEVVWNDKDKGRDKSMMCHWMTPIHHNGYLYGCSGRNEPDAQLRCIQLETGKVMWNDRGFERTSLLMVDGHFVCLDERGLVLLLKVNPEKLEVVSRLNNILHPNVGASFASMIVAFPEQAGTLAALARFHQLYLETPILLEKPCWAAPILAHGLLYLRGKDHLICLELIPQKP